jgi:voltage-gated potassium channel
LHSTLSQNSTLHHFTSLFKLTTGFRVEWPQLLDPGLPRMEFTQDFTFYFINGLVLAWPLLGSMALLISLAGVIVGKRESWEVFDSIYWAFITATTVGYGDIRPLYRLSKILAILIALQGMVFTGIMVALAINAAEISFEKINPGLDVDTAIEKMQRPSFQSIE